MTKENITPSVKKAKRTERASSQNGALVVLGGAGAMGRITVRDLVETASAESEIVIADYNLAAAEKLARSYKNRRVRAIAADVTDVRGTARALKGSFAVVNAVQYQLNVPVMQACLAAGAHYVDLGGLFHVTKQQLKLHGDFRKAGLLALLGMGAAPGIVNLLARSVADEMASVSEIHIQVGNIDRTPGRVAQALGTSYSILTILDESTKPAALFTDGKLRFVDPMSGAIEVRFPDPVGVCRPAYTLHSEVATLPQSYAKKGVREVSFRIAFDGDLDEKLRFLRALGLSSAEPLQVGRKEVIPRDVLLALLKKLPAPPKVTAVPDEYEVLRAVVRGTYADRPNRIVEEIVDCHVPGIPAWGMGIDVDTGCPPSIAVQMLQRGEISARGALPPELAIPVTPFFAELAKRGMSIRRATSVL